MQASRTKRARTRRHAAPQLCMIETLEPRLLMAANPVVAFALADSTGLESATPASLAVSLSAASADTVTVDYSVTGGSATGGGTDYVLSSGTLTFAAGETTKNIEIIVVDDALSEGDETIIVTLSNADNARLNGPGRQKTHTYTIEDNDAPPPTVEFDAVSSSGAENPSPVNLAVSLSAAAGNEVTIDYVVTGGTATGGGTDYTLASGTLTFAAGETTKNIAISVANDQDYEGDETIIVTLSNVSANATLGANAVHTYTIEDNDPAPVSENTDQDPQDQSDKPGLGKGRSASRGRGRGRGNAFGRANAIAAAAKAKDNSGQNDSTSSTKSNEPSASTLLKAMPAKADAQPNGLEDSPMSNMEGKIKADDGKDDKNPDTGSDKTEMRDYAHNPWIVMGDKRMSTFANMWSDPPFLGYMRPD